MTTTAGFLGAVLRQEGILKVADKKLFMHLLVVQADDIAASLIEGNLVVDPESNTTEEPAK
nr:hypothetical protein BCU57_09915 [Shewanella sp. 10N.286.48.B5]